MTASERNQSQEVMFGSIANFIQIFVGFVGLTYISQRLSPEVVGTYFFVFSIVKMADGPMTGIVDGAKKRFSESGTPKGEILGMVVITVIAVTLALGILLYLIVEYTQFDMGIWVMLLFIGVVPLKSLLTLSTSTGKIATKTGTELIRTVIRVSLWVLSVIMGYQVLGLIVSNLIASIAVLPIALWIIGVRPKIPSRETLSMVFDFGKWSILSNVTFKINDQFTPILLGLWVSAASVASFEVSMRVVLVGMILTSTIGPSVMSRISDLDSRGKDVTPEVSRALAFSSILMIPIFLGSLVVGEDLIRTLFGQNYRGLGFVVSGVALSILMRSQSSVMGSILAGMDRIKEEFIIRIITSVVGASVLSALTFYYGIRGAVVGLVIWNFLTLSACVFCLRDVLSSVIYKLIGKQIMSGLVMYLVISVIYNGESREMLIATVLFGGVVYFGIFFAIESEFRELVYENLRNRSFPLS